MRTVGLIMLWVVACVPFSRADACCMVPFEYPGDVDQSVQEVVVAFHEGQEDLVLRVRPFFEGAKAPPASLAWLITVPNTPSSYEVADAAIFDEARALANRLEGLYDAQRPKPLDMPGALTLGADGASKQESHGLEVGALVEVGPYAITPVKARGAAAVGELNRYLESHGFGTEDPAHLAWFAENEFTFLCIQITPPAGAARLGEHLDLVPLHVRFAAEQPYYPGKYSAQQGNFALALTLLTTEPAERTSLRAVRERLEAWHAGHDNLFTVQPLAAPFTPATAHARVDRWYVNRFDTRGFNPTLESGEPAIHTWADDVTWTLGGAADLPPDWYYGDGERPVWHATDTRTVAQYAIYAAILAVLIAILWTGLHVLRRVVRTLRAGGSNA